MMRSNGLLVLSLIRWLSGKPEQVRVSWPLSSSNPAALVSVMARSSEMMAALFSAAALRLSRAWIAFSIFAMS